MSIKRKFRPKLAKEMNEFMRANVVDDVLFWEVWNEKGLSQPPTKEDFEDIECDDVRWQECLEAFMVCVMEDGKYV